MHTQTAPSSRPTTTTQLQNEVVTHLLPAVIAIREAIERLAGNQATQFLVSTPAPPIVEPITDEAVQGNTPANGDNSSAAKRPISQPKEGSHYFAKTEIEAMFKKERDRATTAPKAMDLTTQPREGGREDFRTDYNVLKFQKFDRQKGNPKKHVSRFLDSLEKYAKDSELCLREFSKLLMDRA